MQHSDDHNAQSNVNNGITKDVWMVAREWHEDVFTVMRLERSDGRAFSPAIFDGIMTAAELFITFYQECPAGSVMQVRRADGTEENHRHIADHPAVGQVRTFEVPV